MTEHKKESDYFLCEYLEKLDKPVKQNKQNGMR